MIISDVLTFPSPAMTATSRVGNLPILIDPQMGWGWATIGCGLVTSEWKMLCRIPNFFRTPESYPASTVWPILTNLVPRDRYKWESMCQLLVTFFISLKLQYGGRFFNGNFQFQSLKIKISTLTSWKIKNITFINSFVQCYFAVKRKTLNLVDKGQSRPTRTGCLDYALRHFNDRGGLTELSVL